MKTTSFVQPQGSAPTMSGTGSKPWYVLAFFAIGTLVVGMLTAYLSFSLFPFDHTYKLPGLYPPQWLFWVVWFILYPTMGLAAGHIWLKRDEYDIRGAMIFYLSVLLTNFMFLPIANVSKGNPAIMTFMDINGILTAVLLGWLFSRYSRTAFYYLLPLILWMPITALFKILLWLSNP
ncbi:tryptophan-rich sensory protein [Spirosoma sp. KCTC 42546]|uniref:TspO/MBR family protein n=1 Tax=Spirosoma sp. KCTC 42546 TaxID=2520506 RepID=UPI001159F2DA|nr:TspO/MBR family protein [Spirosoma sp. KCTC 42546]QDK77572.1 tryptophan-rich sensory protein [Spirosoma sp. KCTC 42546]